MTDESVKAVTAVQANLSPLAKKEQETAQALERLDSFFTKPLTDGKAKMPMNLVSSIAKELEEEEQKEMIENFKAQFKKLLISRKEFMKKVKEKKEEFEKTMIDFHTSFNKECAALMSAIEKTKAPEESVSEFLENVANQNK